MLVLKVLKGRGSHVYPVLPGGGCGISEPPGGCNAVPSTFRKVFVERNAEHEKRLLAGLFQVLGEVSVLRQIASVSEFPPFVRLVALSCFARLSCVFKPIVSKMLQPRRSGHHDFP